MLPREVNLGICKYTTLVYFTLPRGWPLAGPGGQVSPRGRQEEGQHAFAELWAQPSVGLLGCVYLFQHDFAYSYISDS